MQWRTLVRDEIQMIPIGIKSLFASLRRVSVVKAGSYGRDNGRIDSSA